MTSSFLVKIAFLNALLILNGKWFSGWLLSVQNRFGTNNISHGQRRFRQYDNHRVLKYLSIIT